MPRLRSDTASKRRTAIIEAALACIAERGLQATTIADICQRAGVSPGAIYVWFDSKEAIIEAVAAERHARERSMLDQAIGADLRDALHAFLAAYLEWLADAAEQQRRRVSVQVWAQALVDERLRGGVLDGISLRLVALARVHQAQADGALPASLNPDSVLRVILALIQGLILQQAWEPDLDLNGYRAVVDLLIDRLTSTASDERDR